MDINTQPENSLAATTTSTVTSISRTCRTGVRPIADAQHESCWCGQEMDVVRGTHCPRCGTMRARLVEAPLPSLTRLAA